jgi:predicted ATPase/DNA-binding CsgD family transcriptional regulator/tetratricopeptide (TPR) repeat protein
VAAVAGQCGAGPGAKDALRIDVLRPRKEPSRNLPQPLTGLLGRESDRDGVADLLSRSRLLTLVGPGGVGKSRLALAVASDVSAAHGDGARLCDLVDVPQGGDPWPRLADALDLAPDRGRDLARRVIAHLRGRQLLLVLDNCEHLAAECADLARSVAGACPRVSLLATSRQPLGVVGERVWPLAGLGADAARLFCERAGEARPDFTMSVDDGPVVSDLCRRLDELPLAIELAAGLVSVLSPAEILARLDDPSALLVRDGAATPTRHRSLAASLEWSHRLLSEDEAVLLRRLAVFAGGCTLAAAEAVCGAPPLGVGSVLRLMASLVAKSLVVADRAGDETRYRLLETTRQWAAARLAAAEETEGMQERHAMWFLALAKEAEPNVRGSMPGSWLGRLATEHDNVSAALQWTLGAERTEWALGIAAAMAPFWQKRCLFGTGTGWLATALELPDQPAGPRAEALLGLGSLIGASGDPAGGIGPLQEALRLATAQGDASVEARALQLLGHSRIFLDVPTNAMAPLECSTEKARAVGDRLTLLLSLSSAGWVAMFGGEPRVAEARFRDCLAAAEGHERTGGETLGAMLGMGWAALAQGRHDDAEVSLLGALGTADRMGNGEGRAAAWCFLGQLARARGDYDEASALLREALAAARVTRNAFTTAVRLTLLGTVAHFRGDLDGAEASLVEAVAVAGATELPFARAQCLLALASLRVTLGDEQEAAALLDEVRLTASAHGFRGVMSAALLEQARLRRLGDDLQEATRALTRAIQLQERLGERPGLVDALEALAGIRASQGRSRIACRLFAAASAARRDGGLVRPPVRAGDHDADVDLARRELTPGDWKRLWAGGESLSLSAAAALAVNGQGRRHSPKTGWEAITPMEREVVALVAQGLTNREAAARLVVSPRTVETHVAHVLGKIGLASRRELARVAAAKGLGSS